MRPVIYLCLIINILHGEIHCDHHPDHDQKDNHQLHDHHGKEHQGHEHTSKENMDCHKIAAANTEFAFKLYKQIAADANADNVFFSPVSISTALAMVSLGARSESFSQTIEGLGFNLTEIPEEEIHKAFHHLIHMLNEPSRDLQLSSGSALFIDENLKMLPKFLADVKNYYDSEAFSSDFRKTEETKKQINDHVEKHTNGKIVNLLQSLDERSVMVLVNYILFKGKWEKVFDPKLTREGDFFVDQNTTVKVQMMKREDTYNSWRDHELSCTVVRLTYAGNASAFLVLPDKGKLKEVEDSLSDATLEKWRQSTRERSFSLYLPKFSITATIDLKDVLMKIGITEIFSDAADLSGITGHRDLKASNAVHKAVLSIDEQGTEAAAATAIEFMPRFMPHPVLFNKPFLLLLHDDNTKSLLFLGKIADPTKA